MRYIFKKRGLCGKDFKDKREYDFCIGRIKDKGDEDLHRKGCKSRDLGALVFFLKKTIKMVKVLKI